jgi:hypothetical protein
MNNTIIKIVLVVLLFGCLFNFPYGYYQFVRFAALIGFGYLAYNANENGYKNEAFIYLVLAILFQPFIKVALGRTIWNIVDIIVAIGLITSISKDNKSE